MLCFANPRLPSLCITASISCRQYAQVTRTITILRPRISPDFRIPLRDRAQTTPDSLPMSTKNLYTTRADGHMADKKDKKPADPRPSSSVLLISPSNEILLLHRIQKSSAFPSAHVFPGGNVDPQDGAMPPSSDPARHLDNAAYRLCAIRETFEESGILLARNNGFGRLIEVSDAERDEGRKAVHKGDVSFTKWLSGKGGRADVEALIPFTRWVTPTNVPKRFTTQMYVYFMPLQPGAHTGKAIDGAAQAEIVVPVPKSDGGIEHTAARFLPPAAWIEMARSGEIILFPPQLFLLSLIAPFLSPAGGAQGWSYEQLKQQRAGLRAFLKTSDPPWADKCISPTQVLRRKSDGRAVLGLDKPGPELEGSDRKGEWERVVLVKFSKEGPREVEVRWRKDVFEEERQQGKL